MVGLIQLVIYLLCAHLIYKAIEIFQIGYTTPKEHEHRSNAIAIGIILFLVALAATLGFCLVAEMIAQQIGSSINNIPKLK